ncbi:protoporphyrinogen/coproporphyrinogen oxidase [Leucobacter tenebrionis]|uniref:protoporphyrinogen/coproporphyrinogen oxidase n=1 Tax=Leucobacter tenebrionis TaxID=2873270 RepID=UPI001CA6CC08|nr:FAD-dependent oxidoreductase [Leucobacter tenebrionis]QZY53026.1 FAD-dependent oxidoreductase [Leucobacter tenebrionis]
MTADLPDPGRVDPRGTVAVVGGGVSGLVAARRLAQAGCAVTLFESEPRLGGRIRSADHDGAAFDIGAEAFATRGGTVSELLAELGLEHEVVRPAALGSWLVTADRAVPLPPAGTLGIPAAPLSSASRRALGLAGALRAAVEPLLPRGFGARSGPGADAEATVGSVVRRRLGSRVLDRLVRPVCLGVHSSDPERLALGSVPGLAAAFERTGSLIAAARELRGSQQAAGGAVAGLRGGMTVLIDALAAELDRLGVRVETGVLVESVSGEAGATDPAGRESRERRIAVRSAPDSTSGATPEPDPDAVRETHRFDAVILAVPESAARAMLGAPDRAGAETLVEVVALVLDDPRLDAAPRGTGALVARSAEADGGSGGSVHGASGSAGEPIRAKALTHVTAKWAERAREMGRGKHVLRLSYGRAGSPPETLQLDDTAARRLAVEDASRILGLRLAERSVLASTRRTWTMGAPAGGRAADPEIIAPPGVVLAGDWVSGTGLASVIPGARAAAQDVIEHLRGAEPGAVAHDPAAQTPETGAAGPDPSPRTQHRAESRVA